MDFFSLIQGSYVESDLVSAGMPAESLETLHNVRADRQTNGERWNRTGSLCASPAMPRHCKLPFTICMAVSRLQGRLFAT